MQHDDQTIDAFLSAVQSGMGMDTAADHSGLPARTAKRYLSRGVNALAVAEDNASPLPEDELDYVDFAKRLMAARARAKVRNVLTIQQASGMRQVRNRDGSPAFNPDGTPMMEATGDWRAAAWWLERMYPDEYGQKMRTELSGPGGQPVQVESFSTIDVQISMEHAAHPARTDAIAHAMIDAGLLPAPQTEVIDVLVIDTDDESDSISFS